MVARKKAYTESMNTRRKQVRTTMNEVRQLYDYYMTANDDNGESAGKSAEHYQARIEKEMDKIAKLQKAIVVLNEQHLVMQEDQKRIGMKPYAVVPAHHNVMLAVRELDNYYQLANIDKADTELQDFFETQQKVWNTRNVGPNPNPIDVAGQGASVDAQAQSDSEIPPPTGEGNVSEADTVSVRLLPAALQGAVGGDAGSDAGNSQSTAQLSITHSRSGSDAVSYTHLTLPTICSV